MILHIVTKPANYKSFPHLITLKKQSLGFYCVVGISGNCVVKIQVKIVIKVYYIFKTQ